MRIRWFLERGSSDGRPPRTISLWRRNEFMGHASYEYAEGFEKFVNWARRFVIRGKKYSEMSWNHSSEDVRGMDSVVLIRALPTVMGRADADSNAVLPNISWQGNDHGGTWTVDDVVDRSGIGELPLSTITETNEFKTGEYDSCVIEDEHLDYGGVQLRRFGKTVGLVLDEPSVFSKRKPIKSRGIFNKLRDASRAFPLITLTIPESYGSLLTYQTFTQRYATLNGYSRVPAKDEVLNPLQADARLWQQLGLRALGVAYNLGACEQVHTVDIDHEQWPVSTLEVYLIMGARNGNAVRFKEILWTLKENLSYKEMGFRDLSSSDRTRLARGWPIRGLKGFNNKRIASGEMKLDIEEEMIEMLREKYAGNAIVWIDAFDSNRVQFTFRRTQFIVRCLSPRMSADRAIAIVEGEQWAEFVSAAHTGPLQMVAGVQPLYKVKRFGSGLNPLLKMYSDFDGWELKMFMVPGLFANCVRCGKQEPHGCFNPEYAPFDVDKRFRIA